MPSSTLTPAPPTPYEHREIEKANRSERRPVIFVHGLWLLSSSWTRWVDLFDQAGFACLTPGWPDDPDTVTQANHDPVAFAGKTIGAVADHFEQIAVELRRKPLVIGHSFGGLLAQILAGRGLNQATVAIDPAPFRGVLPLPLSALKSAWPVLSNPANRHRAVSLSFEEFRYAFANAVTESEAQELYENYAVPAPGAPLFQAAVSNFNPWTEARVDHASVSRGPMLIVSGEKDHTVPPAVAEAAYHIQRNNPGITEFVQMTNRGHALTIDSGWREVAETALAFVQRFA